MSTRHILKSAIERRGATWKSAACLFRACLGWLLLGAAGLGTCVEARAFTHPGIPLTIADLDALKANLGKEPWKSGYAALAGDSHSQLSYTMEGPFTTVSRNPNVNLNQWRNDMRAVRNLALMWYFTGNSAYAQKSHDILLAWATTQTSFGGIENSLDLGDYVQHWAGGADILRGTWPGWTQADTDTVKNFFLNVYWPAAGCLGNTIGPANKGTLGLAASMGIAVFCDDTSKRDKVLNLMLTSASAGFPNTLSSGEIGETGRDQGHASGDWGNLALTAEMLWKQGIDVYSYLDNRILAAAEYFSRWNQGITTPFIPYSTTDQLYANPDTTPWGGGMPGLNLAYSAYVVRKGMSAPYLKQHRDAHPVDMDNFVFYKPWDTSTATPPTTPIFPSTSTVTTGLTDIDIDGATPAGSSSYVNGTWTVNGGGTVVWTNGADNFHFTYRQMTGDCAIIARVSALQNAAGTAKAGLMIRDSLSSTAANRGWVAVTAAQTVESYIVGNTDVYGGWRTTSRAIPSRSYWVKIERQGQLISFYASLDGASWGCITSGLYYDMPSTVYLGLMVCSQNSSELTTGTLTNVSITGGDGGNHVVPPAPFAVYASPGAACVPLRWSQSFGATSYSVLRSTASGGPYTTIATGLTNESYVDANLPANTTYYYVVHASNADGTSGDSPADTVTTQPPPPAPRGVTAFPGNARAVLVWNASSGAASYNVKRSSISGGGYVTVANVTSPSYVDTSLSNGATYYYVVSAVSAAGESGNSSEVAITPSAGAAPTLFWSGAVNGSWDTATANWLNAGASAAYADGEGVIFDDSTSTNTTVTLSGNRSPAVVLVNNSTNNYTFGGSAISGATNVVKQGGGSLTLNAANTYSGGTTISGGAIICANAAALGSSGPLALAGGTLVNSSGGQLTLSRTISVSGSNQVYLSVSQNIDMGGSTLTGNGTITWGWGGGGWSSIWLPRNNQMTGGSFIIPDTPNNFVRIDSPNCGNANLDWIINENTAGHVTLGFSGGTLAFGSLSGSGFLDNQNNVGNTLSIGGNNNSTTFSGQILNDSGLTLAKVGSGTLTLTSASAHSGPSMVSQGELVITTALTASGSYTVANGATLGVSNASSGSAHAANLTVSSGGTLEFQNVASTTTALISAANVTLSGPCTVKIDASDGLVQGQTYPLLSYSGAFQGSLSNVQLQMPAGLQGTLVATSGQIALSVTLFPPAAPVEISTVQTSGTQATISWQTSDNAAGYTIKRSASPGGPYTIIATNVTGTSYLDSGLTSGRSYYYVVSASNAAGVSADSPEAGVTLVSASPVAWLKFDESSGTVATDSAGNGWNGTLANGASWVSGKINNAMSLNGTSQYASLPTGVVSTLADFTISAWVKLNSVSNWARLFDIGTGTSVYMFLAPQNGVNGKVRFAMTTSGTGGEQVIDGAAALPTATWTHVAVTLSGGTGTLYVNGVAVGTNAGMTLKPSSLGSTTRNYIGRSQFSGDPYLNGAVDDFRIYGSALTAADIQGLATMPPDAPAGLVASGTTGSVSLSWNPSANATNYTVWRSPTSGSGYVPLGSGATESTSYLDAGLGDGATYYYVVTASNIGGPSANSNEAVATTYTAVENWRQSNFGTTSNSGNAADGADPDGDGLTNAQEFAAGTDPKNAASALRVSSVLCTGNDVAVSFPSVTGKSYRLERSGTLQPGSWTTVQDNIAGTGSVVTITDPGAAAQTRRFYRIIVL